MNRFRILISLGCAVLLLGGAGILPVSAEQKSKQGIVLKFVGEDGKPLPDLPVGLYGNPVPEKPSPATDVPETSDASGEYAVPWANPFGRFTVRAGGQQFLLDTTGGNLGTYTLMVHSSAPEQGEMLLRVQDPDGLPVPDLILSGTPVGQSAFPDFPGRKTDASGLRQAVPVSGGSRASGLVTLTNNCGYPAVQTQRFTIDTGLWENAFTFVWNGETPLESLDKVAKKVVLTFQDPSGMPQPGLNVEIYEQASGKKVSDGITDYGGKYLLFEYGPEIYRVSAEKDGQRKSYTFNGSAGGSLSFTLRWQ